MSERKDLERRIRTLLKGDSHMGGCMGEPCGGGITSKTRAGWSSYREFMKEQKDAGVEYCDALYRWRSLAKPSSASRRTARGKMSTAEKGSKIREGRAEYQKYIQEMQDLGVPFRDAQRIYSELKQEEIGETKKRERKVAHKASMQKGRQEFQQYMRDMRAEGFTREEALDQWNDIKKSMKPPKKPKAPAKPKRV